MQKDIVVGQHALEEALRASGRVNRLYVARESRASWVDALADEARSLGIRVDFVPQGQLNRMAGTRDHYGAVAEMSPVAHLSVDDCVADCGDEATVLVLDEVQNPHNIGMLLRTALGAGVAGVVMPTRGGRLVTNQVVRASQGAVFRVPIAYCTNTAQALRTLREADFWLYGLDAAAKADVFRVDWPRRVALVVGNEASGIRPVIRKTCDQLVRIPLAGHLDSLNVAVAAAIALFQVGAKRG